MRFDKIKKLQIIPLFNFKLYYLSCSKQEQYCSIKLKIAEVKIVNLLILILYDGLDSHL